MIFTIKEGDTKPALEATLIKNDEVVDLTGCDVVFSAKVGWKTVISRNATIKDAANGVVLVVFQEEETKIPGLYTAEFKVEFPDGKTEIFPSDSYVKYEIKKKIGEW